MIENSNRLASLLKHAPARDMAAFRASFNSATQAFAVDDGNAQDVQTTGGGLVVINDVPLALPADAAMVIADSTDLGIWVTATAYATSDIQYVVNPSSGLKQWYCCIAQHTSSAATKPDENDLRADALWKTYWSRSTQTAENASGDYIPNLHSRYYLALADVDGTITMVKAGPIALDADVTLVIPNFEPERFVCIGKLLINSAGFTLGTTSTAGVSTFTQWIGPCFPTGAGIDQN